jgi:RNA polymerase sigma-70 factor, ECF subfamily
MASADDGRSDSSDDSFRRKLREARGGSRTAIGEILWGIRPDLKIEAINQMGPRLAFKEDASDVVNGAYCDAIHDFDQFKGESHRQFFAWLREILRNNVMNQGRYWGQKIRDIRREVHPGSSMDRLDVADHSPTPSSVLAKTERYEQLWQAIERLREDHRTVIRLRYKEGLELREVAQRMQRSVDATKQLWARAVKSLAREIRKSHRP